MAGKITIPSSPAELEEMLNDMSVIRSVMADPETRKEFLGAYARATMPDNGDLSAQIREQTQAVMADMLRENGAANHTPVSISPGTANTARRNAAYNKHAVGAAIDGTYDGIGEFALDVYRANKVGSAPRNPDAWNRVLELSNSYSETDPGSGGFLVPEEMRSNLLSLAVERSVVRQRATVVSMSSLTTKIPYVDETTHSGSLFGGMIFYWVGESATVTATNAKFGNVRLEANKLVGGARIPNELWNDASALRTWLEANAPAGLAFYEDNAFINGTGVGQPLGFLNSPALVQYDRATTDVYAIADIVGMFARMLPSSLDRAVWLCNQTALPQLFGLNTGTAGYPLGVVNIGDRPVFTLLGRPLVVTEKIPALANGSGNELIFADLSYYLVGDRQAVSLDYSEHSRFMNDETEMRIIERVDGRPWIQSAVTPVNGDDLSPFVGISDA